MKKLLIAAVLPLLLIACAKEDDTNPQFRTPTCADTTDDGKFEAFTGAETAQFLKGYSEIPEQEDTSAIAFKMMNGRSLNNYGIDFLPYFVYKRKRPVELFMYMPLKTQQEQYYSWTKASTDTSSMDTVGIYNLRLLKLTPGCYRIYYIFSDTSYADTTTLGKVFTKGHYDIEIK